MVGSWELIRVIHKPTKTPARKTSHSTQISLCLINKARNTVGKFPAVRGLTCDNLPDSSSPKSKKGHSTALKQGFFLWGRQEQVAQAQAYLLTEDNKVIWDPLPGRCIWEGSWADPGTVNLIKVDMSLEGMTRQHIFI